MDDGLGDSGPEDTTNAGSSTRTAVLIGGAALTVVGLATGIGFTIYKNDREGEVEEAQTFVDKGTKSCEGDSASWDDDQKRACELLPELIDQRDRAATFATIGFVTAGVAAVATVATYFLWQPEAKAETARVSVAPLRGGALFGVSGSF